MVIDYKKELEAAARSMILVHEPDTLIKMIVRMIVQKVRVSHAGILLHNQDNDSYILSVSRGPVGLRVPAGFARMDTDNPLIQFFNDLKDRRLFNIEALVYEKGKKLLNKNIPAKKKRLLEGALYQMEMFQAAVCIPSYFRDELLGLLLLGKKNTGNKFSKEEIDFFMALASDATMAIRNAQLFKELEVELDKKRKLFIHTTIALVAAIDAKDHYTYGHTTRVTDLSIKIAKKLGKKNKKAFDEKLIENLHTASLLHDIGKIGIPETILNKNGLLTKRERGRMQEHPAIGTNILQPIEELGEVILGVKHHHERYDGSGYPDGLKGDKIPLISAIIAVADTYDAMKFIYYFFILFNIIYITFIHCIDTFLGNRLKAYKNLSTARLRH